MKTLLTFVLSGCLFPAIFAQDLIVKTTDEEIIAKVTEIQKQKVLYKEFEDLEGETKSLPKAEILVIVYEDGMKQYFQVENTLPVIEHRNGLSDTVLLGSSQEMYYRGVEDAKLYYHRPGPMWGTFGATAFYPLGGIFTGAITGGIIAAVPPDVNPSMVPNPEYFHSSPDYKDGFHRQAHRIKIGNTAKGFGLGMAVQALWITILIVASN
ncbi:MAG: hypothetical protein SF052_02950 [Bacteroidia bacterium]|nr:hypothetical protein [Bacteroidia bacterium]